jgi:cell wall-associated NlpC family hydrolase
MQMAVASRQQKLREMTMRAHTKPAANMELRPLENHQLEMAHAVDAIDQALSNVGLTWSWLAQIVTGGVARRSQRRGGSCGRMIPPTVFDLSSFFGEWARNSEVGARVIVRAGRGKCSATSGSVPVDATVA